MTYTKKTSTNKTDAKTDEKIVVNKTETTEPANNKSTVATTKETKKKTKKFEATDAIACKSIVSGSLGMIGIKSGVNYEWAGRGDVTEVEYQDLVAAIRSGKRHITEPFFIIQDKDFLEQFPQIDKIYLTMYSINDMEDLLLKPDAATMIATIKTLPDGARESIKNIAATLIAHGRIDSVSKIRALDEYYDTKFTLMSELFE